MYARLYTNICKFVLPSSHRGMAGLPVAARILCVADFLVGFALLVTADLNGDLPVEPLEKTQKLVGGEPAEMPVHQV